MKFWNFEILNNKFQILTISNFYIFQKFFMIKFLDLKTWKCKISHYYLPFYSLHRLVLGHIFTQNGFFWWILIFSGCNPTACLIRVLPFLNFVPNEPSDEDEWAGDKNSREKEEYTIHCATILGCCVWLKKPVHSFWL